MITKTTNLDGAYQQVFDEIRAKSTGALDINNIEGYFGNLLEITALDKKYLRLPVDEPLFAIDANSRKIDIPSEFKSNGLAVQGDHLAQTVYFSIDRYFDYMDLSTCDISINWKMGSETGKTQNFIMSTDIMSGYIVFGWPINKTVTAKSGSLQFAVEFSKRNGDNITYALNTLAANINIKDGLIVENVEPEKLENDILSILTNSQFGEGDAAVGDVHWLTGDGHGLVIGYGNDDTNVVLGEYADTINLRTELDDNGLPISIPANLYAEAFVDAGTEIKYMNSLGENLDAVMSEVKRFAPVADLENLDPDETYYDAEGNVVASEDLETASELFVVAPLNEELKYYVLIAGSNPIAYRLASEDDLANVNTPLYIKLAKLVVSGAGSYIVKAQGQKLDTHGHKIGAGAAISCDPIIVPDVLKPSEIAIEKSEAGSVEEGYSFNEEASANVVFLNSDGEGKLTASAVVDDFGALQFVWQKKVGNAASFSNVAEGDVPYILSNSSDLNINEAGEYKVKVKNFKNNSYADEVVSDTYVASPLAGKIVHAVAQSKSGNSDFTDIVGTVQYDSVNGSLAQRSVTLGIKNVEVEGQMGTLSYEWYKQNGLGAEATFDLVGSSAELQITSGDGHFMPVVKNNYNGSIFTYILDSVSVDDMA